MNCGIQQTSECEIVAAIAYGCGPGLVLGVPGAIVSLASAAIFQVGEIYYEYKMQSKNSGNQLFHKSTQYYKCQDLKNKSIVLSGSFLIGMLPIGGGVLGYRFYKHHENNNS